MTDSLLTFLHNETTMDGGYIFNITVVLQELKTIGPDQEQ